jgi:hypothetical protein
LFVVHDPLAGMQSYETAHNVAIYSMTSNCTTQFPAFNVEFDCHVLTLCHERFIDYTATGIQGGPKNIGLNS